MPIFSHSGYQQTLCVTVDQSASATLIVGRFSSTCPCRGLTSVWCLIRPRPRSQARIFSHASSQAGGPWRIGRLSLVRQREKPRTEQRVGIVIRPLQSLLPVRFGLFGRIRQANSHPAASHQTQAFTSHSTPKRAAWALRYSGNASRERSRSRSRERREGSGFHGRSGQVFR